MGTEAKDTKDAKVVIGLVKSIQAQICAAVELLDSPFRETLGGLDGTVFFNGVGLTPGGAQEAEARVAQMLIGGGLRDVSGTLLPDFFAPLRRLLGAVETSLAVKK